MICSMLLRTTTWIFADTYHFVKSKELLGEMVSASRTSDKPAPQSEKAKHPKTHDPRSPVPNLASRKIHNLIPTPWTTKNSPR